MSISPKEPTFEILRLREREHGGIARVYDFTNPAQVTCLGEVVNFYGTNEKKKVDGLSNQWLTEITVVAADGAGADQKEIELAAKACKIPALSLIHTYSCSSVGANLRILKSELADVNKLYSYMIVDEVDPGEGRPLQVKEIWVAECNNPADSKLKPAYAVGKQLRSPESRNKLVQWEAIQFRMEPNNATEDRG